MQSQHTDRGRHVDWCGASQSAANQPTASPPPPSRRCKPSKPTHQSGRCLPTRFIHFLKLHSMANASSSASAKWWLQHQATTDKREKQGGGEHALREQLYNWLTGWLSHGPVQPPADCSQLPRCLSPQVGTHKSAALRPQICTSATTSSGSPNSTGNFCCSFSPARWVYECVGDKGGALEGAARCNWGRKSKQPPTCWWAVWYRSCRYFSQAPSLLSHDSTLG